MMQQVRVQKKVFKKNRRGQVAFIVREAYLRDDLSCGVDQCQQCVKGGFVKGDEPVLVLDARVLREQTDLFVEGLLRNCIVPESALQALDQEGLSQTLREVREVLETQAQAWQLHVLSDEHMRELQLPRVGGEAEADFRRRQGETATLWLKQHVAGLNVTHVEHLEEHARRVGDAALLARCAWIEADESAAGGEALFEAWLDRDEVDDAIEAGVLREVRYYGGQEAVEVESGQTRALKGQHRGLAGDRLAIDADGSVRGLLSRRHDRLWVGALEDAPAEGGIAVVRCQDGTRVALRGAQGQQGRRLAVRVDSWPRSRPFPLGHVVRDLGGLHESSAQAEGLLLQHGVRAQPWNEEQLAGIPPADWVPGPEPGREDLRHLPVCSVDPPGCTDIDDALHARRLPDGSLEVGVHIADVSRYVAEGSPLDLEARQRATTVYLVGRRIDMLPARLSGDLCSLRATQRHAMSVIWRLDAQGRLLDTRFCRSLIRSRAALSYGAAQALCEDEADQGEVATSLRLLQGAARLLRARRLARGALLLSQPQVRFVNEKEGGTGDVVDAELYEGVETNSTVEEFMLLANICVANRLWSAFPALALLRRHAAPDPDRWRHLLALLEPLGVQPASMESKDVSAALETAPPMARVLVTRYMQQAQYVCSGAVPEEAYAHYGLACPIYTHFTSPIRRYADLVVHRLLACALGVGPMPRLDARNTQRVARHINHRHRMAQLAGRSSAQLAAISLLRRDGARQVAGTVLAVRPDGGARCIVPSLGLEVLLAPSSRPFSILQELELRLELDPSTLDSVQATLEQGGKKRKT